jgi:hypothetical protein
MDPDFPKFRRIAQRREDSIKSDKLIQRDNAFDPILKTKMQEVRI